MSWTKIIHHGRKWTRADNHMDARHCPECGATVHGNRGQHDHQQHHIDMDEVLAGLAERSRVLSDLSRLLAHLSRQAGVTDLAVKFDDLSDRAVIELEQSRPWTSTDEPDAIDG